MKTLLLHSYYTDQLSYYDDWVDAFESHKEFETTSINVSDNWGAFSDDYFIHPMAYKEILRTIEKVDLIILHHSMNADTLKFIEPFISALSNRRGKLVSFVGNEVNLLNIGMAPKIKLLQDLKVDIIATQLLPEAGKWLYESCKDASVLSLPHGLNPAKFYNTIKLNDRKIDIGTRSTKYGVYLGDNDRNSIINYFHDNPHGLNVDLGLNTEDSNRFDRNGWRLFLNSCKATLATEAGSFYLEPSDEIVSNIKKYLIKTSPKLILPEESFMRRAYRFALPSFLRKLLLKLKSNYVAEISSADQEANFQDIYEKFFAETPLPPVYTKCISSRHFEAVGTQTLQIMYPGRYNDILNPREHFFELQKDHSNIDDLLSLLDNRKRIEEITSYTHHHVLENHTHRHRLDYLLESI